MKGMFIKCVRSYVRPYVRSYVRQVRSDLMSFIKRWICKFKGHDFRHTGAEQINSAQYVHWLECERCGLRTHETKGVNE